MSPLETKAKLVGVMSWRNSRASFAEATVHGVNISRIRNTGLKGKWKSRYILNMYMKTRDDTWTGGDPFYISEFFTKT